MRIANVDGRLKLVLDGGCIDVERSSGGSFSADPQLAYTRFDELRAWSETAGPANEPFDPALASSPVPSPRQVFAIALNYADHAAESGFTKPAAPLVFTKFPSAIAGPVTTVTIPPGSVDWEVEIVAVIGRTATEVPLTTAWNHVAGLTIGQDLSERVLQRSGPAPQYSLGKSYPGFAPMGPCVVTPDELEHRDDLALGCAVNGVTMQEGHSADMIFPMAELVSYLSGVVTLFPGDIIFSGTPPGVGMGRTPPVYLAPGDTLHSWIEGIGSITQSFVAPDGSLPPAV